MKLLCIFVLALAGCATNPPVSAWSSGQRNACLPEAAVMCEGLRDAGIKSQVVVMNTTKWSHAIVSYIYPTGENTLWVWDATWKSNRVRAFFNDPMGISRAWLTLLRNNSTLVSAEIL